MGLFTNALVTNITIGENVVWKNGLMVNAFRDCTNLKTPIPIPNNVTNMYYAFQNCYNYNHPVNIPATVTNFYGAFGNCVNFNSQVTFADGVNNVSTMVAFSGCTNFNKPITIPNGVTNCYGMFRDCTKFNQPVNFPVSVNALSYTFQNCTNLKGNIYVFAPNVTSVSGMFNGKNNSKRIDVYVPNNTVTKNTFNSQVGSYTNVTYSRMSYGIYNSKINYYVYWNTF